MPLSIQVQLRDDHHPYRLVQPRQHTQTQLISIPVETTNALLTYIPLVQHLYSTHHSSLVAIGILQRTLIRVYVFVEV